MRISPSRIGSCCRRSGVRTMAMRWNICACLSANCVRRSKPTRRIHATLLLSHGWGTGSLCHPRIRANRVESVTMNRPGKLKLYLGYAAGVGKTYQMLEEAQILRAKGVDVVIGYFEPHGRKDTIAKTAGIETVPRRRMEYRGSVFEEMDTEAIIARHPQVTVVDEFPHTNVPGSARLKRWEDVLAILENGIDVLTTMNVQHLESLNDQMEQITGVKVRETIPDWVVKKADEVIMVDLTPRALLNRLERGVVYPPDKAQRAMQNFFKESTLVALREMALRQTAQEVEERIDHDGEQRIDGQDEAGNNRSHRLDDAVIIYVSDDPTTAMLIRRGKRVADVLQANCFAVFITDRADMQALPAPKREAV